jgi:hypothetical protein
MSNLILKKILSVGAEFFQADGQTDRHDETNSCFSRFRKHAQKEEACVPIDMAIPADRNVVQKEAEKKLKYKSLCTEIQRMWDV